MKVCLICDDAALFRHVVWTDHPHRSVTAYCEDCWHQKWRVNFHIKSFQEFEETYNTGNTRLFEDFEAAELFSTKSLL